MIGKLTPQQLNDNVIKLLNNKRSEVLLSSSVGQDCAILSIDKNIYVTTDPITSSLTNCGTLAINICANDLAACGSVPLAAVVTILAPTSASIEDIKDVMEQISRTADKLNMDIVGGHTEFTDAVNKMIVSCTAIGASDNIHINKVCRGDKIIVTKTLGIEGTAIAVNDNIKLFSKAQRQFASDLLDQMSVVKEGLLCGQYSHSMHDITEGGVVGAISELKSNTDLTFEIDYNKAPFDPLTIQVCDILNIDKYKMYSSGSMLIITDMESKVLEILKQNNIKATTIGCIK